MSTRRVAAAIALAIAIAAAPAHASPELDRAQDAIDDIDFEGAKQLVETALERGKLSTADLARAHRLAGEIAAALDDAETARDHFVVWILLEPDAALPEGASPKLTEPFGEARDEANSLGAMEIEVEAVRDGDSVRVILAARDPLNLIAGLRVEGGGESASVRGTRVELPVGAGEVELTVTALDDRDDAIAVRTITVEARGSGGSRVRDSGGGGGGSSGGWPTIIRWPTWTVLAVAGFATGGYFGWQVGKDQDELDALNADSMSHTFDEALAIEERGKRHALYADIAFGVGGAFAVAAVLTFFLEPDRDVEVAPVATAGGAGVTAAVRF